MLKHKESSSSDGVYGGQISQSDLTGLISEENRRNPDENIGFFEKGVAFRRNSGKGLESKPSRSGTSQELTLSYLCDNSKLGLSENGQNMLNSMDKVKRKLVISEDENQKQDESRWVERDFLQLSANSSQREVEDDEIHVTSKDKKPKMETLDLSLSLPDVSLSMAASNRVQNDDGSVSLKPSRSLQSLAWSNSSNNTQTTFSNDFTAASLSNSYSHQFSHNPSCSMTRNSSENFEYSMGSRDQFCNGGEGTNGSVHSRFRPVADGGVTLVQANRTSSDNNLSFFPSELPARPKMDAQSGDSRGRASENTKGSEGLDLRRSHKPSRPERILREIVSESIPTMAQIIQEFTDETIESTKDYLKKLISVPERRDELVRLQLRLERRSDLTSETLSKANKNQLQVLVSIRMGLESFLSSQTHLSVDELTEIFLFERCKNVNCKRLLPVEDCDCKICSTTKGFCSECMCPVCLNFDCANNTCSWVGCDVCSHWCHAACGIQKSLIKPGPSLKGPTGTTEMQFHCLGCGHASEMFGFIKDVFKSCAEQWSLETLMKELDYVRKIFTRSEDIKGKKLCSKAGEMVSMLENKVMSPADVCSFIVWFFDYVDGMLEFPTSNHPSKDPIPSKPQPPQTPFYDVGSTSGQGKTMSAQRDAPHAMVADEWSVKSTKKDGFESMESLMRIKEAEASMFQNKADEARREVEGYKRMIRVKMEKLDDEYTEKIAKLCLRETEETRKRKAEAFKVSENAHCDYYKMKMRMLAEIAGLLERMENTKQQLV